MKIVVDANIVFSGILNSNGKIGDLLINSGKVFSFIAPDFLRTEIYNHHNKLVKMSNLTLDKYLSPNIKYVNPLSLYLKNKLMKKVGNSPANLFTILTPITLSILLILNSLNANYGQEIKS